jgi:hypothetical protein
MAQPGCPVVEGIKMEESSLESVGWNRTAIGGGRILTAIRSGQIRTTIRSGRILTTIKSGRIRTSIGIDWILGVQEKTYYS